MNTHPAPPLTAPSLMAALELHYEDLVDYIRQRFGSWGFARDVIHDVCVEMIERPPSQQVHTPLAFLRRVSRHRAIDRSRSEATRRQWIDFVDEVPDEACHVCDGAWELEFKQQLQALVTVIEGMPPRPRQIFLLHRVHGMKQDDIARELDISRNMVAQHLARALQLIRTRWAPACRVAGEATE